MLFNSLVVLSMSLAQLQGAKRTSRLHKHAHAHTHPQHHLFFSAGGMLPLDDGWNVSSTSRIERIMKMSDAFVMQIIGGAVEFRSANRAAPWFRVELGWI